METVLSSRGREVVIAGHRPFVIIGERINPTGRKVLAFLRELSLGGCLADDMGVGKTAQVLEVLAPHGSRASRIILAGLGKAETLDTNAAERMAAAVIGKLLASGEKKATFAIDVPPRAKVSAAAFAAHLASGPALAYARMKENLNRSSSCDLLTLLDQEALNMRLSGTTTDHREAARAFVEKRRPTFSGE